MERDIPRLPLGLGMCIHWWNIYVREEGPWKKHMQALKVDLGNPCVQGILGSWITRARSRRDISLAQ